MPTRLLTRSDVKALLDRPAVVEPIRAGFIAYSRDGAARAQRVRADAGPGTTTVLFPGMVGDLPAYSVKVHAKFPGSDPAIRGLLCLHDAATGDLLAVMESSYLTAVRTGLAGALASHVLARPDAKRVAVIGAGVQGRQLLSSLTSLRSVRHVRVFDVEASAITRFATDMRVGLDLPVVEAGSVAEAVSDADIVLAATWAQEPFLTAELVRPGMHVTTLGPDEPGKAEVAAEVIRDGVFVCDDRDLAVRMGALAGVGLSKTAIAAELGEVLAGDHPGREAPEQITVYGGVGLAFQDVVVAWAVYRAAQDGGRGQDIDLLD